jgi:hypothetical protein
MIIFSENLLKDYDGHSNLINEWLLSKRAEEFRSIDLQKSVCNEQVQTIQNEYNAKNAQKSYIFVKYKKQKDVIAKLEKNKKIEKKKIRALKEEIAQANIDLLNVTAPLLNPISQSLGTIFNHNDHSAQSEQGDVNDESNDGNSSGNSSDSSSIDSSSSSSGSSSGSSSSGEEDDAVLITDDEVNDEKRTSNNKEKNLLLKMKKKKKKKKYRRRRRNGISVPNQFDNTVEKDNKKETLESMITSKTLKNSVFTLSTIESIIPKKPITLGRLEVTLGCLLYIYFLYFLYFFNCSNY